MDFNTPLGNVGMLLAVGVSCVALFRGAVAIATAGLDRHLRRARSESH